MNTKALGRAIRYLGKYRSLAYLPYLFLFISTLAQLMVPRMVRNIIDSVTQGVAAQAVVPRMESIPAGILTQILDQLGMSEGPLLNSYANAEQMLINAGIAILIFAGVRGLFAFLYTFTGGTRHSPEKKR